MSIMDKSKIVETIGPLFSVFSCDNLLFTIELQYIILAAIVQHTIYQC